MAQLPNPLNKFQSHSTHYVILAARSTEDVRIFTESSSESMSSTLSAIDAAKQLGDEVKVQGKTTGGVYLMVDTRRFSQFSISDFSIKVNMNGFSTPGAMSTHNSSQEMSFTLLDSMGISFVNFLQYLMDQKLQVSYQGMTLLVKVLFMGHKADGKTEIVQSIGIPATFDDIHVDLNEVKGVYACKCICLLGMASNSSKNPMWTAIGTASSYFTGEGANTLGAVISSFESRLNDESLKRYVEYNAQSQTPGEPSKSLGRFGRPVQFMITIPPTWEAFKFSGPTQGGAVEVNFKELLKTEEANRVKAKKADTDAILGNFKKNQNKTEDLKFYKHLVSVTSDDESFTVHVDVVEYIVPNAQLRAKPTAAGTTAVSEQDSLFEDGIGSDGKKIKVPKNFLEFDYIFSGKNIDVLHLDLKLERLNTLLMQGNRLGQGQLFSSSDSAQKQTDGETAGDEKRTSSGMLAKDPVLLPQRSGDERTNFSNIGANVQDKDGNTPQSIRQQYIKNLSLLYNGPLKAKMSIRGNPDILERITLGTLPEHVSSITIINGEAGASKDNLSVKQKYRKDFETNLLRLTPELSAAAGGAFKLTGVLSGPSFAAAQIFVKVNIFGPAANFITNEITGGNFAERIFYDDYYQLFSVLSKIEGSKFTQEFELSPISVYGYPNVTAQAQATPAQKVIK
jgi:hypothetical protein